MNTKHGVVAGMRLTWLDEDGNFRWEEYIPYSTEQLMDLATERRFTHLWVMPGLQLIDCLDYDRAVWDLLIHYKGELLVSEITSVSGWKLLKQHGNWQFQVIFLEHTVWYRDHGQPGPLLTTGEFGLLCVIRALEQELHVPMSGSPQTMGWKLLKQLHPAWFAAIPRINLRECHFDASSARDLIWARDISPGEGPYVQCFDRGLAYAAAGAQTQVGAGTPEHVDHGDDCNLLNKQGRLCVKKVGVWHCEVENPAGDASSLPTWKPGKYWLVGPMINLLRAADYHVTALEGWVFPEQHEAFTQWANILWNAGEKLEKLSDVGLVCYKGIRKIAHSTVGQTASHKLDDEPGEVGKRRPDIKAQLVGRNAEIMWFNIDKVLRETGVMPFCVYMDAVYYLSPQADGRAAFPLMVAREGLLGGYRYKGRIALDEDLVQELNTTRNASKKLEILNKIGWEQ